MLSELVQRGEVVRRQLPVARGRIRPHLLGLVAPAITDATPGCDASPAIASSSSV